MKVQRFKWAVVGLTLATLSFGLTACSSSQLEEGADSELNAESGDAPPPDEAMASTDSVPTDEADGGQATPPAEDGPPPTEVLPVAEVTPSPTPEPIVEAATQAPEPIPVEPQNDPIPEPPQAVLAAEPSTPAPASVSLGEVSYTVHEGDTLMKIAFETYGDIYAWKKIYDLNRDQIKSANSLEVGASLKLEKSAQPVEIERNGERFKIRSGDTLGKISNEVYGTQSKWKRLWQNNRQLIKNPNRIFAGFYLYYVLTPEDEAQRKGQVTPALGMRLKDYNGDLSWWRERAVASR